MILERSRKLSAVRVTGGELAGRTIEVPRREEVRPTADRVRESLFARLGPLDGLRVLDLYAGSGSLGIEALSRGAERAVFVDRAAGCATRVRANLAALGLEDRARVLRSPAKTALTRLARDAVCFDLVLLDPPYASDEAADALPALAAGPLLAADALLVLETHRRHDPGHVAGLRRHDERRYGDTLIIQFARDAGEGAS